VRLNRLAVSNRLFSPTTDLAGSPESKKNFLFRSPPQKIRGDKISFLPYFLPSHRLSERGKMDRHMKRFCNEYY
jgi:hypothetical protein